MTATLVSVRVDAEVLATDADGRCQLEDGPALAAEIARRPACDAAVVGILEDGDGNPLNVGPQAAPSSRRCAGRCAPETGLSLP